MKTILNMEAGTVSERQGNTYIAPEKRKDREASGNGKCGRIAMNKRK
jgi:hypothetical protein